MSDNQFSPNNPGYSPGLMTPADAGAATQDNTALFASLLSQFLSQYPAGGGTKDSSKSGKGIFSSKDNSWISAPNSKTGLPTEFQYNPATNQYRVVNSKGDVIANNWDKYIPEEIGKTQGTYTPGSSGAGQSGAQSDVIQQLISPEFTKLADEVYSISQRIGPLLDKSNAPSPPPSPPPPPDTGWGHAPSAPPSSIPQAPGANSPAIVPPGGLSIPATPAAQANPLAASLAAGTITPQQIASAGGPPQASSNLQSGVRSDITGSAAANQTPRQIPLATDQSNMSHLAPYLHPGYGPGSALGTQPPLTSPAAPNNAAPSGMSTVPGSSVNPTVQTAPTFGSPAAMPAAFGSGWSYGAPGQSAPSVTGIRPDMASIGATAGTAAPMNASISSSPAMPSGGGITSPGGMGTLVSGLSGVASGIGKMFTPGVPQNPTPPPLPQTPQFRPPAIGGQSPGSLPPLNSNQSSGFNPILMALMQGMS